MTIGEIILLSFSIGMLLSYLIGTASFSILKRELGDDNDNRFLELFRDSKCARWKDVHTETIQNNCPYWVYTDKVEIGYFEDRIWFNEDGDIITNDISYFLDIPKPVKPKGT